MNSVQMYGNGKYGFGVSKVQKPGPNHVLIKVHSAVINPSDLYMIKGWYDYTFDLPFTPGWEGSGTVIDAGPGMLGSWLNGKRVAFMKSKEESLHFKNGGSMAEYILTDSKSVVPIADDISLEQASSFFVNPLTALGLIDRVKELGAKSVIITAAASQLSRMVIKLC